MVEENFKEIEILTERERYVLLLRYGLLDDEFRTWKQLGEIFQISGTRIGQLEMNAMKKIDHAIAKKKGDINWRSKLWQVFYPNFNSNERMDKVKDLLGDILL